MRRIHFSDIGVVVNSLKELDELYLTYTVLGIPIQDTYKETYEKSQNANLTDWYTQCTRGCIETKLDGAELEISLIYYPIRYSIESLDFAIACQLLMSNQEDELIAHLDKYCKEYK